MAQMVLIMGESGTGKSTSLRNCDPATTAVVNPVGKPLPFKGKYEMLNSVTESRKITKEEFGEGVKRLAQQEDKAAENPADGAMNPPESGRRTRRSQAQEQKQTEAAQGQDAGQDAGARTRRTRRTR